MRVPGCPGCTRLADDYVRATLARFKLDGQYKLAVLKRDDPEKIREFLRRLETAEVLRQQTREKLRQHEREHHDGTAETG